MTTVKCWKLLTIVRKGSIFNVVVALDLLIHLMHFFLPTFFPSFTFTLTLDAKLLITSLFFRGLYWRDFSAFLIVLDFTAELLNEILVQMGVIYCKTLSMFSQTFSFYFLYLLFFISIFTVFDFNSNLAHFLLNALFIFYSSAFFSL